MKIRLSLLVALLCAFVLTPVHAAEGKKGHEEETELGAKMDKMGSAFRALRRQISDASKNADSLARLAVLRENAEASLKLDPAKKADLPPAEQAKFVADYRAKMKDFLALVDKVEAALKANNNDEAAKLVGVMADAQKAGHKEFQKKKKKD